MTGTYSDPGASRPALIGCAVAAAGLGWLGGPAPSAGPGVPPAAPAPRAGQGSWRFEGEYGLYVGLTRRGLEVRWLTNERLPGLIRAIVNGRVVDERRTDSGHAHMAELRVEAPVVTIEYGADQPGRLQRTEIRPEGPPSPEIDLPAPDSVFVFGDVHGEFDRVVALLRRAGLIDAGLRWTGGSATVALLGDLFDRGDDVTRLLWFVYELEREAAAAGGRVVTLLGNHEAMVMSGDLRYVSPKEMAIADRHDMSYAKLFDPANSILGRWLAAKPGLVRLGDLLLAHGASARRTGTYRCTGTRTPCGRSSPNLCSPGGTTRPSWNNSRSRPDSTPRASTGATISSSLRRVCSGTGISC